MIRNVSYNNKVIKQEILDLVGKPFPLMERIKSGGYGSQRLLIIDCSEEIEKLLNLDNNLNHCNIELREGGIIIRFRSILNTIGWIIPFYKLNIFKNKDHYAIYADEHYIRVTPAHNERFNPKFFRKLSELKAAWHEASNPI
jgi:hypothetical protein